MTLNRKVLAVVPALVLLVTGCGGFSASRSVSPATFLLPGLMKADPPAERQDQTLPQAPAQEPVKAVARL